MAEDNRLNINSAQIGLNTDSTIQQVREGQLLFAQNAQVESFDGQYISYSNESANNLCVTFPEGYKVIGVKNITAINRVLYWITNPSSGDSEIGYSDNGECVYNTLISDAGNDCKFNFSIDHPIRKAVVKTTNCATQVYWTDGYNPRRYIDFSNLPWKEQINPNNSFKPIKLEGQLDCNKLNVQPNISIPSIKAKEVTVGGSLIMGTYQFAIQYANSLGEGYTSYYGITNPLGIFENKVSGDFNLPTSKAITISIDGLDTTALYEYYNIAVIKTINNITTVELAATLPISGGTDEFTYTGNEKSPIQIDVAEVLEKFPYYDTAQDIFEVDNILGWANLKQEDEINYQQIWNKVHLQWETVKIPYNQFQGYSNGVNTEKYRGYFRDEVYAFEGCFILKNGKQTKSFHIPGRAKISTDSELIPIDNKDNSFSTVDPCATPTAKERWEVYNTGWLIGKTEEYLNKTQADDCYVGPYEYGEMAYWQSDVKYPNNPDIWGELAGQPIKHHKFPDVLVSNIVDNNTEEFDPTFQHSIFPIGVRIDVGTLYDAIYSSDLTQAQKDEIVGFRILRGNRATNKSIIAKGILHNVGETTYDDQDYLYPNYPYNDLREDPYFIDKRLDRTANRILSDKQGNTYNLGYVPELALDGFGNSGKDRFTFHSPDTHFYQPSIDNVGEYLKLDSVIYGRSYGHFVPVKDNAEYKFLTTDTLKAAAALAKASAVTLGAGQFGSPTFNAGNAPSTFVATNELFEKIAPYTNFGYSYFSYGLYGKSCPIENAGYKQRGIIFNKYLTDGINSVEDGKRINNIRRESSVYVKTNNGFKFTDEYCTDATDTSRFNIASLNKEQGITWTDKYIKQYRFTITSSPQQYPAVGEEYIVGNSQFKLRITVSNLQLSNPGNFGTPVYTGYVYGLDVDTTNSVTPPNIGILVKTTSISNTSPDHMEYSEVFVEEVDNPDFITPDSDQITTLKQSNIASYYGAIKKENPTQWGHMYSYETIETGYFHKLYEDSEVYIDQSGNYSTTKMHNRLPAIFGGDCYINRFAYKSKIPIFRQNTVAQANGTDVQYNSIGTLNYPMFWISTKPANFSVDIQNQIDFLINSGAFLGIITGGITVTIGIMSLLTQLFKEIYEKVGIKNINLDRQDTVGITEQGLMYLFVYGIPYFFCESEINVDYRQAYNEKEGNFFPNVGEDIPDDWLQEVNVPIINDNTYTYNQTYSKQNKENFITHLREDFDKSRVCYTEFPNRVIWSDSSSQEETKNNWLVYRGSNRFDLPKAFGELVSIDNIEHRQLLVRFENRTQLYNALQTVNVNQGPDAYLGNTKLFAGVIPLDLATTDIGYAGSQHQFFVKTEFGHIFVDSKRGQVIITNGSNIKDIADTGMDKWFSANLPFKILDTAPEYPIDNAFGGVGLHGVYDAFYQRLIITKLDYEAKDGVSSKNNKFYYNGEEVAIGDEQYFRNVSWTISYSFKTNTWISFHSYQPNYYIPFPNYFQSGINSGETLWNHNKSVTEFQTFYGEQYPYILEYPFVYKLQDEILQSIRDYSSARIYSDIYTYYEPQDILYFNKAIVWNSQQCSGILNLVPKKKNNLAAYMQYPKYNADSIDIQVVKSNNFYNFNGIWDNIKEKNAPFFIPTDNPTQEEKHLTNIDYSNRSYKKHPLMAKDAKVRLILDNKNDFKLISRYCITEQAISYK